VGNVEWGIDIEDRNGGEWAPLLFLKLAFEGIEHRLEKALVVF